MTVFIRDFGICVLVLLNLSLLAAMANSINNLFVRRSDRRVEEASIIKVLFCQMACVTLCNMEPFCDKFTWNDQNNTCYIAKQTLDKFKGASSYLELATGWTSYEKVVYTVSAYRGRSGKYTLTFQEGVELCNTMGTSMASKSDLLKARTEGLALCQCGWLTEGYSGFVIQEFMPTCWTTFETGVIWCRISKAAVYCRVL